MIQEKRYRVQAERCSFFSRPLFFKRDTEKPTIPKSETVQAQYERGRDTVSPPPSPPACNHSTAVPSARRTTPSVQAASAVYAAVKALQARERRRSTSFGGYRRRTWQRDAARRELRCYSARSRHAAEFEQTVRIHPGQHNPPVPFTGHGPTLEKVPQQNASIQQGACVTGITSATEVIRWRHGRQISPYGRTAQWWEREPTNAVASAVVRPAAVFPCEAQRAVQHRENDVDANEKRCAIAPKQQNRLNRSRTHTARQEQQGSTDDRFDAHAHQRQAVAAGATAARCAARRRVGRAGCTLKTLRGSRGRTAGCGDIE